MKIELKDLEPLVEAVVKRINEKRGFKLLVKKPELDGLAVLKAVSELTVYPDGVAIAKHIYGDLKKMDREDEQKLCKLLESLVESKALVTEKRAGKYFIEQFYKLNRSEDFLNS